MVHEVHLGYQGKYTIRPLSGILGCSDELNLLSSNPPTETRCCVTTSLSTFGLDQEWYLCALAHVHRFIVLAHPVHVTWPEHDVQCQRPRAFVRSLARSR